MSGWGSGYWGAGPWGAGGIDALRMLGAEAVRENVVRVTFNAAPLFDRLLGPNDASDPKRFQIVADVLTIGRDGEPARPVLPVLVEVAPIELSFGAVLDVTTDRPLSPWPTYYRISATQLVVAATGGLLDPAASSREFQGLYRELRVPTTAIATPSQDVASPAAGFDVVPGLPALTPSDEELQLGTYVPGDDGDYATDSGIAQLRKRIFRRFVTAPGAFAHLPGYGLGVRSYGKRLGTAAVRQQLVATAMAQLREEPDVVAVKVRAETDARNPSITRFFVDVKAAAAPDWVTFDYSFGGTGNG